MTRLKESTKLESLTPTQSARIRGRIARDVELLLDMALDVVQGKVEWSPTQARVFGMLLNKTVPDLSASFVQSETKVKALAELTREELEEIANGTASIVVHDLKYNPKDGVYAPRELPANDSNQQRERAVEVDDDSV